MEDMSAGSAVPRASIEFKGLTGSADRPGVMLSVDGGAPRWYFTGDHITGNVVLEKIGATDMEVRYVNPLESIPFIRTSDRAISAEETATPVETIMRDKAVAAANARRVDVKFPDGVYADGVAQIQEGQYTVDGAAVKNQLAKGYVYKHAQFRKAKDGGYVIDEIARDSLFEKGGFRDGDVIQKINDKELSSIMDLMAAYRHFNEQRYMDLTVVRGNQRVTHYYFLK